MKIVSPLPHKKARIEIVPLIDIMFFLLAAFMMVSLTMIHMQSIKVNLPTATQEPNVGPPSAAEPARGSEAGSVASAERTR